jgi:hypothetical protein
MKLKRGFNKFYIYTFLFIILLLIVIFTVNALITGTKHNGGNILVSVDGKTMTLGEAITHNYLISDGPSATSSLTTSVSAGHNQVRFMLMLTGLE